MVGNGSPIPEDLFSIWDSFKHEYKNPLIPIENQIMERLDTVLGLSKIDPANLGWSWRSDIILERQMGSCGYVHDSTWKAAVDWTSRRMILPWPSRKTDLELSRDEKKWWAEGHRITAISSLRTRYFLSLAGARQLLKSHGFDVKKEERHA